MVVAHAQQVKCPDCKRPVAEWTPRGLALLNVRWGVVGGNVATLHCGHKHPWHKGRCGREITVIMGRVDRQEMGAA